MMNFELRLNKRKENMRKRDNLRKDRRKKIYMEKV